MDDFEPRDVLELMADEYAREILAHLSRQQMSAKELSDVADVSERTVYRRLEQLQSFDLISEELEIDRQGNHHKRYRATFQKLTVELTDAGYEVNLQIKEDAADRFARMWGDIRRT